MKNVLKRPLSILLAALMVMSLFVAVPITASANVGDFVPESDYLTFTAEEANSSVTLEYRSCDYLQYNKNNSGWQDYSYGTLITLASVDDYVRFRGSGTSFNDYHHVSLTGKVACSGSVMSLRLDNNGKSQGLSNSCFQYMFDYCDGLTTAPELPETTLATSCYFSMFRGCTSLTKAPVLPATTLAKNCYRYMFRDCDGLTELPALPATTLADHCYAYMFYDCENIRISDEAGTFGGITYSAEYRIPSTGTGTPLEDALDDMFGVTGGKFTGTPNINTTYYLPAPAPSTYTVTWKNGDTVIETDTDVEAGSAPSFNGTAPTKAADDSKHYTFAGWFDGTNTYAANALPVVSGDVTYTAQFTGTNHTWDTANAVWDAAPVLYADPDNYGEDAYKADVTVECSDCHKTKTFTASTSGRFFAIEDVSSDCEEGIGSHTKVTVYATIGGTDISHVYRVNEGPVEHDFVSHVAAKAATYNADGNIEYWQCAVCGKYFSDEDCTTEITQAQTVIPMLTGAAAQVGDTKYGTLEAAFAAAQDGDTITVLADTTIPTCISNDKNVTLDCGTYNVTATGWAFENTGSMTITATTGGISGRGIVDNYGDVTFDGGTYSSTHNDGGMIVYNNAAGDTATFEAGTFNATITAVYNGGGTVDINGGTFTAGDTGVYNDGGTLTVDGGSITANGSAVTAVAGSTNNLNAGTLNCTGDGDDTAVYVAGTGTKVVVDGATITASDAFCISSNGNSGNGGYTVEVKSGTLTASTSPAIYNQQSGTLDITGGTITGTSAVYIKSGTVTISGGTLTGTQTPATDYEYYGNGTRETGDAVIVDNCNYPAGAPTVSITGGTFVSNSGKAVASYTDKGSGTTAPGVITEFISGGNFSSDVSDLVVAGNKADNVGAGTQGAPYTITNKTLQDYADETVTGGITGLKFVDSNQTDVFAYAFKASLLGVQIRKNNVEYEDTYGLNDLRYVAAVEKTFLAGLDNYGFAFSNDGTHYTEVSCKGTENTVITAGQDDKYEYFTAALKNIPDSAKGQKLYVKFYVKDGNDTAYAKYTKVNPQDTHQIIASYNDVVAAANGN